MTQTAGHESSAFDYAWSKPTDCDTFTLDHYRVCRLAGASAPAQPNTTGAVCAVTSFSTASPVSATDNVHRSDKQFASRVFACDDTNCNDWFGKTGHGTASWDSYALATEPERWVLEDVSDYDDNDRVIDDNDASAAAVLFYPGTSNKLGIWWSTHPNSGVEVIKQKRASDPGWKNWNTYSSWTSETTVTESTGSAAGMDFGIVTHPWVVAAKESVGGVVTSFIWMFVHADDDGAPGNNDPFKVWSARSTDTWGADFGLTCTVSTGCSAGGATCANGKKCDFEDASANGGAAQLELCSDGTSACDYQTNSGHGALAWDYIASSQVEPAVDEPFMMFTGFRDEGDCDAGIGTADDLYSAWWDTSSFSVDTSGICPVDAIEDAHDPGLIPLPGGEFKVYHQIALDHFEVCYGDGDSFGDCVEIELAFHSAYDTLGTMPTVPLGRCLENMYTLVHITTPGPTINEGAFFKAGGVNQNTDEECFDCDNCARGIVFAEHRN